jgi:CYTH domain-containing protein
MSTTRRFLIASSLARLIRKDRGGARVTEGYFPNQTGRSSHVHVEGDRGSLVLVTVPANGPAAEERTDVPRTHAEALLDVAPGKVEYARSRLTAAGREIRIDRFVRPGPLDLISVEFDNEEQANGFRPPLWFGPEVTSDATYQNRAIALGTLPSVPDVSLTNAALDSLLDSLENRLGSRPLQSRPLGVSAQAADTSDALRRLSATFGAPTPGRESEAASAALGTATSVAATPAPVSTPAPAQPGPQSHGRGTGSSSTPSPSGGPALATSSDLPSPANSPGEKKPAAADAPRASEESDGPNLDIEDDVIRELARSLRPNRK